MRYPKVVKILEALEKMIQDKETLLGVSDFKPDTSYVIINRDELEYDWQMSPQTVSASKIKAWVMDTRDRIEGSGIVEKREMVMLQDAVKRVFG